MLLPRAQSSPVEFCASGVLEAGSLEGFLGRCLVGVGAAKLSSAFGCGLGCKSAPAKRKFPLGADFLLSFGSGCAKAALELLGLHKPCSLTMERSSGCCVRGKFSFTTERLSWLVR